MEHGCVGCSGRGEQRGKYAALDTELFSAENEDYVSDTGAFMVSDRLCRGKHATPFQNKD